MSFTDEEIRRWHQKREREREQRPQARFKSTPAATCIHCQQPFGITEGVITDEVALCDVCNGD